MERIFSDQMNRTVRLEGIPRRIVSLVPSQTELLFDLGLRDEVVGITKFCIYPEVWFRTKVRVGGTKQVNIDKVKELRPDLIIGNKEENTQEDILALERIAPVWMSDINSVEDALDMIKQIGELTGRNIEAEEITSEIQTSIRAVDQVGRGRSVLYFIWKDPLFCAGKNTFIDAMITAVGCRNACSGDRYPEYSAENCSRPDLVFLSSEPYPFEEKHKDELADLFPGSTIALVDGEMFSWYGSRMRLAPKYFKELFDHLTTQ